MLLTRLIIILVLLAGGSGLLVAGVAPIRLARASRRWAKAEGHVTGLTIEPWGLHGRIRRRISWGVKVTYDYRVDGYIYQGNRRTFTIWRLGGVSEAQALELAGRYPPGKQVTVWYDPAMPGASVLEPKVDWMAALTAIGFAALFLGMGIYYSLILSGLIEGWE